MQFLNQSDVIDTFLGGWQSHCTLFFQNYHIETCRKINVHYRNRKFNKKFSNFASGYSDFCHYYYFFFCFVISQIFENDYITIIGVARGEPRGPAPFQSQCQQWWIWEEKGHCSFRFSGWFVVRLRRPSFIYLFFSLYLIFRSKSALRSVKTFFFCICLGLRSVSCGLGPPTRNWTPTALRPPPP